MSSKKNGGRNGQVTAIDVPAAVRERLEALLAVEIPDFRAMVLAAGFDPATSFRGKTLTGINFGSSDLSGFDFSGADLSGCDFRGAKIKGVIYTGACLNGVRGLFVEEQNVSVKKLRGGDVMPILTRNIEKRLAKYFNNDNPLGPIRMDWDDGEKNEDSEIYHYLINVTNEAYSGIKKNLPSAIIGRRGSGKSTLLLSVMLAKQASADIVIKLPPATNFKIIVEAVHERVGENEPVELIASFWRFLFWCAIFKTISERMRYKNDPNVDKVTSFIVSLGIGDADLRTGPIFKRVMKYLKSNNINPLNDSGSHNDLFINFESFYSTVECALHVLEENDVNAVVLIDSLENFPLSNTPFKQTIAGFLRAISDIRIRQTRLKVLCCLPSELYPAFSDISSNTLKDFGAVQFLFWRPIELLQIAASRYITFLSVNHPELYVKYKDVNIKDVRTVKELFGNIMPKYIEFNGKQEVTIAFIVRHTQLLPRHLLFILQNIIRENSRNSKNPSYFTDDEIKKGVFQQSSSIYDEIFKAYKEIHPSAQEICETILCHLPNVFDFEDVHWIYQRYGKKLAFIDDIHSLLSVLVDIGAIGIKERADDIYTKAVFSFTTATKMRIKPSDVICVHPLFSEAFSMTKSSEVVYPVGAEVELW